MTGSMSVDSVLSQIRAIRQEASERPQMEAPQGLSAEKPGFGDFLSQSVNSVNEVQKSSAQLADSFERGDTNVSLAEVMVASQKADVSFTAMVEVRNKMIDAYQEVMRMSV
ncbi:MAG: flagellar hook-basal body complex protein FliE [Paracoccaceae bacterium]|jgi:flagellar hook-basal body complex protein FliE